MIEIKSVYSDYSNCYIVSSGEECAVIDPSAEVDDIIDAAKGKSIRYILLTHGHYDHIIHAEELSDVTGAEICIHESEKVIATDKRNNCSLLFQVNDFNFDKCDVLLKDDDIIKLNSDIIKVIHTPGHTPGSVCYLFNDDSLISGDTLFCQSIGRTDLPLGDYKEMMKSLKKIIGLGDDIIIYPGHNDISKIGFEKKANMYLRSLI